MVTTVMVLVTSTGAPSVLAADRGQVVDRTQTNTCVTVARRRKLEGCGFESQYGQKGEGVECRSFPGLI